jgi:hypothetical protein
MATESLTRSEILRLFGTIDDHTIAEITGLNPSLEELAVTESYLAGMTDIMGEERLPLTGKAAKVYEIVTRDDIPAEDEYRLY